jgi:hypothetical protein
VTDTVDEERGYLKGSFVNPVEDELKRLKTDQFSKRMNKKVKQKL